MRHPYAPPTRDRRPYVPAPLTAEQLSARIVGHCVGFALGIVVLQFLALFADRMGWW